MQGEHAHRVWNLIYSQSCFTDITQPDVCTERKVFYRLISGKHRSHSTPQLRASPSRPLRELTPSLHTGLPE